MGEARWRSAVENVERRRAAGAVWSFPQVTGTSEYAEEFGRRHLRARSSAYAQRM